MGNGPNADDPATAADEMSSFFSATPRELLKLFERNYFRENEDGTPYTFSQEVGFSPNRQSIDGVERPTFVPFSNVRAVEAENLEILKKTMIGSDGNIDWFTSGRVIAVVFADDLGIKVSDDELVEHVIQDDEKSEVSPKSIFTFKRPPPIPTDWFKKSTEEGHATRKALLPNSVSPGTIDGNCRLSIYSLEKSRESVLFNICLIPSQQLRGKSPTQSRQEYLNLYVAEIGIALNSVTHSAAQYSFAQFAIDGILQRNRIFQQLRKSHVKVVSEDDFDDSDYASRPAKFGENKERTTPCLQYDGPTLLLHGEFVPASLDHFFSSVKGSGKRGLSEYQMEESFVQGALGIDGVTGRREHHCLLCTTDVQFASRQCGITSPFDLLVNRSEGIQIAKPGKRFELPKTSNSLKPFKAANNRLVQKLFGTVPQNVVVYRVRHGGNRELNAVNSCKKAIVQAERILTIGYLFNLHSVVTTFLLDEHETASMTDGLKSPIQTYVVAKPANTPIGAETFRLDHHKAEFFTKEVSSHQKSLFKAALIHSETIVSAFHAIATCMFGFKSIDIVLQSSTKCRMEHTDNVDVSQFYARHGWHFPPDTAKWSNFGKKNDCFILMRSLQNVRESMRQWDGDVARVVIDSLIEVRSLFFRVLETNDELRKDIFIAQTMPEIVGASFVGSPLLDLEVYKILHKNCTKTSRKAWDEMKMSDRLNRLITSMSEHRGNGKLGESLKTPIILKLKKNEKFGHLIGAFVKKDPDGYSQVVEHLEKVNMIAVATEIPSKQKKKKKNSSSTRIPPSHVVRGEQTRISALLALSARGFQDSNISTNYVMDKMLQYTMNVAWDAFSPFLVEGSEKREASERYKAFMKVKLEKSEVDTLVSDKGVSGNLEGLLKRYERESGKEGEHNNDNNEDDNGENHEKSQSDQGSDPDYSSGEDGSDDSPVKEPTNKRRKLV